MRTVRCFVYPLHLVFKPSRLSDVMRHARDMRALLPWNKMPLLSFLWLPLVIGVRRTSLYLKPHTQKTHITKGLIHYAICGNNEAESPFCAASPFWGCKASVLYCSAEERPAEERLCKTSQKRVKERKVHE